MTTTYGAPRRGRRSGHALADARHRRRGHHRRRVRRRVLGLEPGVRAARARVRGRAAAARPGLRRLADAGRPRPAGHPQARRGAVRRDGRGRRVGTPREPVGRDTLLSGFVQGAAAELVFAFTLYRIWTFPVRWHRRGRECRRRVDPRLGALLPDARPDVQLVRGVAMAISAVVIVAGGSVVLASGAAAGRRARRVPRLTADSGLRAPRPRDHAIAARTGRRFEGISFDVARRRMPAGRRAVGVRQEHARPGHRRPDPARDPRRLWQATLARRRRRVARRRARARSPARSGLVFQDPASQLVMERVEDDVAFGLENRGWPPMRCARGCRRRSPRSGSTGSSGGGRAGCPAASSSASPWPACWRRGPGSLVLDEPTANLDPAGAAALLRPARGAPRAAETTTIVLIEHQRRRRLAAGRRRPRARRRRRGRSSRAAGRGARSVRGSGCRECGIWLPGGQATAIGRAANRPRSADRGAPVPSDRVAVARASASGTNGCTGPRGDRPGVGRRRARRARRRERQRQDRRSAGLLVGLLRPSRGEVRLGGDDPARLPARDLARRAGYVFQDPEAAFLTNTSARRSCSGSTRGTAPRRRR